MISQRHCPGLPPLIVPFAPRPALDCTEIGGRPAGLSAAIYLIRFRRRIAVINTDARRAALIARSFNIPPGTILWTTGLPLSKDRKPK